jgi:hypothetical protein
MSNWMPIDWLGRCFRTTYHDEAIVARSDTQRIVTYMSLKQAVRLFHESNGSVSSRQGPAGNVPGRICRAISKKATTQGDFSVQASGKGGQFYRQSCSMRHQSRQQEMEFFSNESRGLMPSKP